MGRAVSARTEHEPENRNSNNKEPVNRSWKIVPDRVRGREARLHFGRFPCSSYGQNGVQGAHLEHFGSLGLDRAGNGLFWPIRACSSSIILAYSGLFGFLLAHSSLSGIYSMRVTTLVEFWPIFN